MRSVFPTFSIFALSGDLFEAAQGNCPEIYIKGGAESATFPMTFRGDELAWKNSVL